MESRPLIDVLDDFPELDRFHVSNPDPGYRYVWLNAKADNLERMKMIYGYEIVGAKHKEGSIIPPNPAGERKNGDVVLARIPKERYEKIQKIKKQRAENQVGSADEAWTEKVKETGMKVENSTVVKTEEIKF